MELYQLYSSLSPEYNKFGSAKEIWQHVQAIGYDGPTKLVDGYPLPAGEDFKVEGAYIKRTSSLRITHALWAKIDQFVNSESHPEYSNRIQVIEAGIMALEAAQAFGKIYATTNQGVEEFEDVIACIARLPLFEDLGVDPVMARKEELLPKK
ncbi:MAG: hypothetical protein AAF927_03750 [Bacteroidota bacterium]